MRFMAAFKSPCLPVLAAALALALALVPVAAEAQAARSGGGDQALKRAQFMLRQLNQEKTRLEQQVTELQQAKEDLEQDLGRLEAELEAEEGRLEQARETNQDLIARIRSDGEKYRELLTRHRQTVKNLKLANADNQVLVKAVRERESWIDTCRARNADLAAVNQDLLARYKELAFRHTEGITGIRRVGYENEVQEFRFRIEDLQVTGYEPSAEAADHARGPGQGLPEGAQGADAGDDGSPAGDAAEG